MNFGIGSEDKVCDLKSPPKKSWSMSRPRMCLKVSNRRMLLDGPLSNSEKYSSKVLVIFGISEWRKSKWNILEISLRFFFHYWP